MNKDLDIINDDAEDTDKYFDENNYSTMIVAGEKGQQEKKKSLEDFVEHITSGINEDKTEVLKLLKESNAQDALVEAILDVENNKERNLLIAACWESGLDFSKYVNVFFKLAVDKDLLVSLEAITVVENIEKYESKDFLEEAIKFVGKAIEAKHPNHEMLHDLKLHLFEMMKGFDEKVEED